MDEKQEKPSTQPGSEDSLRKQILQLLTPEVYTGLRRLGRIYMQRERKNHTLQPTALVHEALFKLSKKSELGEDRQFNDQQHFYATCARQMRHILVDHAKTRNRERRQYDDDGNVQRDFSGQPITATGGIDFVELDQLLKLLEGEEPDAALVLELYYFGGHHIPAIAKIINASEATVNRRMRFAKAWLLAQIQNKS